MLSKKENVIFVLKVKGIHSKYSGRSEIVVPNFVKGLNGEFGSSIFDNIITVFFGIMFILYTYVFIKSFVKIKKLKEKLQ